MKSTSTERFLNLLESFVFLITETGQLVALNRSANQLLEALPLRDNLYGTLFDIENYHQALDLAGADQKRVVTIHLNDGRKKKLRWEFIKVRDGIVCTAADVESIFFISNYPRNDNLIFKEILLNILPGSIADELVAHKAVHPKVYRHCTILFTDVVDFSRLAFHLDPVSLIRKLNSYFSLYDRVMEEFGVEKIKTIGDSYMAVSGLPVKKSSHAVDCCLSVLNILHIMEDIKEPENIIDDLDLNNWSIRIGIHTGPSISGVVGYKKYTFDIWGDSVNIAARMESAGTPGKINISESTYQEVEDFFNCEYRGIQKIKNIGTVKTYFLNRLRQEFSEDEAGFSPNELFNEYYCKKYRLDKNKEGQAMLPHFILNYLKSKSKLKIGGG